jgi:hypothetical protein
MGPMPSHDHVTPAEMPPSHPMEDNAEPSLSFPLLATANVSRSCSHPAPLLGVGIMCCLKMHEYLPGKANCRQHVQQTCSVDRSVQLEEPTCRMKMGVMDPVVMGVCPCDMCHYGGASFLQTNLLIGSDGSREHLKETGHHTAREGE